MQTDGGISVPGIADNNDALKTLLALTRPRGCAEDAREMNNKRIYDCRLLFSRVSSKVFNLANLANYTTACMACQRYVYTANAALSRVF